MIVVEIKLISAISEDRNADLGTLIIDNITGTTLSAGRADYRVRMYRKAALSGAEGDAVQMIRASQPIREAEVFNHRREAEPVQNLVAKALAALGYDAR